MRQKGVVELGTGAGMFVCQCTDDSLKTQVVSRGVEGSCFGAVLYIRL